MKLDDRLLPVVAAMKAPRDPGATAAERRDAITAGLDWVLPLIVTPGPALLSVIDLEVPAGASGGVPVRVYRPRAGVLPVLVYFHGGGFWEGSIVARDHGCRKRAAAADCVVVSVGYRLAPEHPFPAGLDDCWAALQWVVAQADDLGVDPEHVVVSGESAGANLAAVVALRARDAGVPSLAGVLLEVPSLDAVNSYPSLAEFAETFDVDMRAAREEVLQWYLGDTDRSLPEVSPMLAPPAGLPRTHITTSECDWLRDEGERYARVLAEAGVPVTHTQWKGTMHATADLDVLVPDIAEAYLAEVVAFLDSVFARVV